MSVRLPVLSHLARISVEILILRTFAKKKHWNCALSRKKFWYCALLRKKLILRNFAKTILYCALLRKNIYIAHFCEKVLILRTFAEKIWYCALLRETFWYCALLRKIFDIAHFCEKKWYCALSRKNLLLRTFANNLSRHSEFGWNWSKRTGHLTWGPKYVLLTSAM